MRGLRNRIAFWLAPHLAPSAGLSASDRLLTVNVINLLKDDFARHTISGGMDPEKVSAGMHYLGQFANWTERAAKAQRGAK